jgi:hypothetical protein
VPDADAHACALCPESNRHHGNLRANSLYVPRPRLHRPSSTRTSRIRISPTLMCPRASSPDFPTCLSFPVCFCASHHLSIQLHCSFVSEFHCRRLSDVLILIVANVLLFTLPTPVYCTCSYIFCIVACPKYTIRSRPRFACPSSIPAFVGAVDIRAQVP